MRTLRAIALRLRGLFRSPRAEQDFVEELESHVALHTDAGVRTGLSQTEARRQALIRLGGAEQTRQAHRERRTLPWLESLLRDAAYALRTLARHRGASAIAILSIGLGIGANATIFSMVSRFVLRPAPVGDPSTLLTLKTTHDGDQCCNDFPLPVFKDVRDQTKSFSGIAAYDELIAASIGGSGEPERVWGQAVTANFFTVLQLPMLVGRGFASSEENATEIVLGAGLWQRRFNSDPDIAGKTVMLSGRLFTVIGVAPARFHSIDQILNAEFWVPLGNAPQLAPNLANSNARDMHWLAVVGRLKPGVTRSQAGAELKTLAARLAIAYPETDKGNGFVSMPAGLLSDKQSKMMNLFLASLGIVVLLVLSIAGANVANLLFAQAADRQRDMAVRLALGATRGRLQRQMLTESLLLGLGGGVLGILLSLWSTRALSSLHLPAPIPLNLTISVDWRVLLYSLMLSVLCGMLLGIAPAWAASRPLLANALRGEDALARPGRRISLRNLLVVLQIAMSVVLLCVTGLFLRSLESASGIDIGFRSQNLLIMSVDPRLHSYSPERTAAFLNQLRERAEALPGVESAAVTDFAPLSMGGRSDGLSVVGSSDSEDGTSTDLYVASPGFFETIGIPRIAGNDFSNETATEPKVGIVNEAFVNRVLKGKNPIGVLVTGGGVNYRIIGVVGNIKSRSVGEETRPVLYRSMVQNVGSDPSFLGYTLVVHTASNPAGVAEAVRRQIHALDPAMAVFNEQTMEEHVRNAFFLPRLAAALFGTFGFIGLALALIGLYGVMSYAVSRRTREIGIRMALGATMAKVQRSVLSKTLRLAFIGIFIGAAASLLVSRAIAALLFDTAPSDPVTFAAMVVLIGLVALLAGYIPARRASRINPMVALRNN